jgi:hypothetical protein
MKRRNYLPQNVYAQMSPIKRGPAGFAGFPPGVTKFNSSGCDISPEGDKRYAGYPFAVPSGLN